MSKYLKNSIYCTLFRNKNLRKNKLQKLVLLGLSITLSATLFSCNSDGQKQNQPTEKLTFSEDLMKELRDELNFTKKQLTLTNKQLPIDKNELVLITKEGILTTEYNDYRIENNGFINLNYFSPIAFNVE